MSALTSSGSPYQANSSIYTCSSLQLKIEFGAVGNAGIIRFYALNETLRTSNPTNPLDATIKPFGEYMDWERNGVFDSASTAVDWPVGMEVSFLVIDGAGYKATSAPIQEQSFDAAKCHKGWSTGARGAMIGIPSFLLCLYIFACMWNIVTEDTEEESRRRVPVDVEAAGQPLLTAVEQQPLIQPDEAISDG